jgi:hypothetical protein
MSNINETASQSTTKVGSFPASTTNSKSQIGSDLSKSLNLGSFPRVSPDYIDEVKQEKKNDEVKQEKKKAKSEEINPESLSDNPQTEEHQTKQKKGLFNSW